MAYRGEDLDLRTPQTWGASDHSEGLGNGRNRHSHTRAPILVDDLVMACCNHAFDVAGAHRSLEVRIEHLLHAMTRLDAATSALEARGLRIAGLRRESATIIASEIPVGLGSGQSRPRRSDDLEAVLRTASNFAARRNTAANIDDVIDALLDMPTDVPGISLLARHGGRTARDRLASRETLPLRSSLPPANLRSSIATDLRGDDRMMGRVTINDARTDWTRGEAPREYLGSTTDGIQNARIEQLENALRVLTHELTGERTAVSGIVQDLQRSLSAERDDTSRFRGGLDTRLGALERAVLDTRGNDDMSARLIDRIASLEQAILDQRQVRATVDLTPLQDRLGHIERIMRDTMADGGRLQSTLADRLKLIERAVETSGGKSGDLDAIASRLDIIEEAVLSSDNTKMADTLSERMRSLEEALAAQRTAFQQATQGLANEVKALSAALVSQSGNADRVQALVTERLQALAAGFERQRTDVLNGIGERLNGLASTLDGRIQQSAQPMAERLAAVTSSLDGQFKAQLTPLLQRLTAVEAQLVQSVERTKELQGVHATELKEVHEALLKLNSNQHTLAGSIDQWRLDGVGDVSVIANRLAAIETAATQPNEILQQLSANVDNIGRATVERYHRRNRFWYWLFGTDDWLGASWPSQVAAVETERQTLRGTQVRTTPQVPR
ncbi:MAG: hypothetical protein K2Y05_07810 [Hyphomicrobiaceae bacterium]|nr:hypothetical protein [Hyphomicrobiaceae bacterium]